MVLLIACRSEEAAEKNHPLRKTDLVELVQLDPSFRLDIRYATTNNFTGRAVYSEARAFLQRPAAEALMRAHQTLKKEGYGLMIFDAYRPMSVVRIFWDVMPPDKKQFVADPANGSPHASGCAVDLTLFDLKTGQAVDMPSEFDEWTVRSASNYPGGSKKSRHLRDLLRAAMEAEGFLHAELEWWHFTYKDWQEYPMSDIPFSKLYN